MPEDGAQKEGQTSKALKVASLPSCPLPAGPGPCHLQSLTSHQLLPLSAF